MSIIYADGDLTVATPTGKKRITYPFPDDPTSLYYEQDFMQLFDNYDTLALDTPEFIAFGSINAAVYLTGESPLQDMGGGVAKWTRTYSVIPNSRQEYSNLSWTRPGLSEGNLYPFVNIISASNSGATTAITTDAAHGMSPGDYCLIIYTVTLSNGTQITRQVGRSAISAAGSSLTVSIILDQSTPYYLTVRRVDQSRDARSITVPCVIQYDYALPGVTAQVSAPSDFSIFYPPMVLDSGGKETETYAPDSSPTRADYLAQVAAGTLIVAEPSVVRPWRGNILERATKYVKAT
jgi:hypothetical protein